jgi:restriction system protein
MDVVAMLPWWGGVALALVSYLVLHQISGTPKPIALQPGQMGDFARRSLMAAFAFYGQFIVPILCLLGALGSYLKRRKREGLVNQVAQGKGADALTGMSVQCKQWKAFKVGVEVVRELYGVMAANGAAGGFVITSGSFTADAQAFADGRNVNLVDGPKLFGLIHQAKVSASAKAPATPTAIAPSTAPSAASSPSCPVCQAAMVRRTAKKGANAGSQFWGCSHFPACRGTR